MVVFFDLAREAVRGVEKSLADLAQVPTEKFEKVPAGVVPARLDAAHFPAGTRTVRVLAARDSVDVSSKDARLRLTMLPAGLHARGLNCFLVRAGARPTLALDLESSDVEVELVSPSRDRLDVVRFAFGRPDGSARHYHFTDATVAVDRQIRSVMLDFGPGRDLVLVYAGRGS